MSFFYYNSIFIRAKPHRGMKTYLSYLLQDMKLHLLPQDIIRHIISYSDAVKYRNGKYMNQISKEDERYILLQTIPRICVNCFDDDIYEIRKKITNTSWWIRFDNDKISYNFCYDIENTIYDYHSWIRP